MIAIQAFAGIRTAELMRLDWQNVNLLIANCKLPKVAGLGLIKKLRAARLVLPMVLVAEKSPTQRLAKKPSLQPAATLLKPIAIEALLNTVKNVLRAPSSPLEQLAAETDTNLPH